MTIRALVVDDDEEIRRTAGDILQSLGHKHDAAGDQEAARGFLSDSRYSYILLDLEIPVCPGRLCRVENGKNLLNEIRQTHGMEDVPVMVMTGHGNDGPDLAVSVMKLGAVDYVAKPLDGDKLDKAVQEALEKARRSTSAAGGKARPQKLTPFSAERREMVIHEDHVTVCGVTVWRDAGQPDMRDILLALSRKHNGRYVRLSGTRLGKALGRNASNPVSRPIKDFRDRATELMASECALECGSRDIIASGGGGGYHFTDWMVVTDPGVETEKGDDDSRSSCDNALNERQQRIVQRIIAGERLQQKDVIGMFRGGFSPSTVKRDIKALRDIGLIETHADGHYVPSTER